MLRLHTLGGLALEPAAGGPALTLRRETLALLALLAVAGDRGASPERVRILLWPERDPDAARAVLAAMLEALPREAGCAPVAAEGDDLRLDPRCATSDVGEFETALDADDLATAVALYTGPFLDEFSLAESSDFERWASAQRHRLAQRFRDAAEQLIADAEARGDERAAAAWRALLVLDDVDVEEPISSSRERGVVVAGRYQIERELGRGGMATVYQALDLKHGRRVALKFVHAELADAFGIGRFQREIELLASLQHPHILALYDSGEMEGALFYVMPFVDGETLRQRLVRESQLPVDDAVRITRQVADALAYAHRQGIIHRDIKPENIFLAGYPDGGATGEWHALVGDFGIARAVSQAAGRRLTDDGFAVGTPTYMSPEQAAGDPVDGRSDEYSLACVLYEMLTGEPPYRGSSSRSILAQRFTEPPVPVRRLRPSVPPAIEHATMRALSRVPADRYATVSELAAAIAPEATTDPRAGRAARSLPRWWRWAVVVLSATLVVALLVALRPAPVDPDLMVVLPFVHRQSAAPALLNGDNCERLLYDAFGRWNGVRLVDDMRARDARERAGSAALTLRDALATARSLRAGRLAWGEVWQLPDGIEVRATVYDVGRGGVGVRRQVVRLRPDLSDAEARFGELADSLLVPVVSDGKPVSLAAAAGMHGTRSIPALRLYFAGHDALADWRLDSAAADFRAAIALDPTYAHAHLWLAEALLWSGAPADAEWRASAAQAVALADRLSQRDSALAAGLLAIADQRFPDACQRYRSLLARDSLDVSAWYGLGECHARDELVVRDAASPSGWAFRGSYRTAADAYQRALRLVPSAHAAFAGAAYERLPRVFFAAANQLRRGFALDPDTVWFAAYPSLVADTLAFVPYPFTDVTSALDRTPRAAIFAAVAQNRDRLLSITRDWASAFPESPAAWEALARALEVNGLLAPATADPTRSAVAAIARARAVADTGPDRLRLAAADVRLHLESGELARARALADSVLAWYPDPDAARADQLKALAALTGRMRLAVALLRRAAPEYHAITADGRLVAAPLAATEIARAMLGVAALGGPADTLRALHGEFDRAVESWVEPARQRAVRDALLATPLELAFPALADAVPDRANVTGSPLYEVQRALARGDTAAARSALRRTARERADEPFGGLTMDLVHQEAALALAVGDTAAATQQLDAALAAIPTLGPPLLEYAQHSAFLVRAMALRADLAAARREPAVARRWAAAVDTLWSEADPALQPVVRRMRALAAR